MNVFISADTLNDYIRNGKKLTIMASLWSPYEGGAAAKFQSHHIPTSVFCHVAYSLAGLPGSGAGRNPMPPVEHLEVSFREWGLEKDRPIVVYDEGNNVYASRAWWTLRWAGVEDVRILDGGLREWDRKGYDTIAGPGNIVVGSDMEVEPNSLPTATMNEVRKFEGLLIDARNESRFAGRREILDLKSGHIPGAVNIPMPDLFDDKMRVRSEDEIRDRFAQVGITQNTDPASVITYSGSGNHSSSLLAVMAHAGLPIITHYVEGWSQWAGNVNNKVARNI
ncbi:sulfurtransferase [Corynebacterium cystitidis]|uniref:sulfurtransferase n=1 Tax=Corynebacterium cystitidis TaxID=35757 RepID=UPI00211E3262|nr:sulfurtransferase [Corynebacterium cystitidis]